MKVGDNRWHFKYICDKCKTVIPYITKKGYRDNLYHHYVSTSNRTAHKDFDLCGNCEKKLRVWLDTKEIPTMKEIIGEFPQYEEEIWKTK